MDSEKVREQLISVFAGYERAYEATENRTVPLAYAENELGFLVHVRDGDIIFLDQDFWPDKIVEEVRIFLRRHQKDVLVLVMEWNQQTATP